MALPVADKFNNLKQVLLAIYEQKTEKILDAGSLGDMKPSDMLAFLRGLQGTALFKRVWLHPFTLELHKQVASAGLTNFDEITKRADLIQEPLNVGQLAAFTSSQETSTSHPPHQVGRQPRGHGSKKEKGKWFYLIYVLTMLSSGIKHTNVYHLAPGMIRLQPLTLREGETRRPTTWSSFSGWLFKKLCATYMGLIISL